MLELAVAAVVLIQKIFAPVAGQIADDAAGAAGSKIKDLYNKIRQRFHKGTYEGNLLDGVEESPGDKDRQDALAKALAKQLEGDPEFCDSVRSLVESVHAIQGTSYTTTVNANESGLVAGGNISVNAGGDFAGGSITKNYGNEAMGASDERRAPGQHAQ